MRTLLIFTFLFNALMLRASNCDLLFECVKLYDNELLSELIKSDCDINTSDENGATPIMWAAYVENFEAVKMLHKKGANLNPQGVIYIDKEKTGYYGNLTGIAAGIGNIDILKYLIESCKLDPNEKEYNPETKKKDGWNPLLWAVYEGHENITLYLLNLGINGNQYFKSGTHILFTCITNSMDKTSDFLIKKYNLTTIKATDGGTPLHSAVKNERDSTINLLLRIGADVLARNDENVTPIDETFCRGDYKTYIKLTQNITNYTQLTIEQFISNILKNPCVKYSITYKAYNLILLNVLKGYWMLAEPLQTLIEGIGKNDDFQRGLYNILSRVVHTTKIDEDITETIGNLLNGESKDFELSYSINQLNKDVIFVDKYDNDNIIYGFENGIFKVISLKTLANFKYINLKTKIKQTERIGEDIFISLSDKGELIRWDFNYNVAVIKVLKSGIPNKFFIRDMNGSPSIICDNGSVIEVSSKGELSIQKEIPELKNSKLISCIFTNDFLIQDNYYTISTLISNKPIINLSTTDSIYRVSDGNHRFYAICSKQNDKHLLYLYDLSKASIIDTMDFDTTISVVKILDKALYVGLSNGKYIQRNLTTNEDFDISNKSPYDGSEHSIKFLFSINKLIVTVDSLNIIQLWNSANFNKGTLLFFDANEYLFLKSEGDSKYYYSGSPSALNKLSFKDGKEQYSFEQFDAYFNNPAKVLQNIGIADNAGISLMQKVVEKRRKKMGFDNGIIKIKAKAPSLKVILIDSTNMQNNNNVKLQIQAEAVDSVKAIHIKVNGCPLVVEIQSNQTIINKELEIALNYGNNSIKISALSNNGIESPARNLTLYCNRKSFPKVYYVGIGVSVYQDTSQNLSYAAKDVKDIGAAIKNKYPEAEIILLTNERATKNNIKALKENILSKTKEDDIVIFCFSGHGLIDNDLDFYYATYNVNFNSPKLEGLIYDDIEWLFYGIPARKKMVLIDACFSGEIDKDTKENNSSDIQENTHIKSIHKGFKPKRKLGEQNTFELMQTLFANLSGGNGSTIISAAAGNEFAYEEDKLKNGVFTYCVLQGLVEQKADENNDHVITVSELKSYVGEQVQKLTQGHQKPTTRQENIEYDWNIW